MSTTNSIDPKSIQFLSFPGQIGLLGGIPFSTPSKIYAYNNTNTAGWAPAIMQAAGAGGGNVAPTYDGIRQVLSKHLADTLGQGLFFVPLPTSQNAGLLSTFSDGGAVNASSDIRHGNIRLTYDIKTSQTGPISDWNKLILNPVNINTDDSSDQVYFVGPVSNSSIVKTGGNNIIFASPVMYQSLWTLTETYSVLFGGYDRQQTLTSFFPTSQGAYKTNTIALGAGNDIVYYDSSFREIKGGDGQNVFLPSFGSFNWAYQISTPHQTASTSYEQALFINRGAFTNSDTFFLSNPVPLNSATQRYTSNDFYSFALNEYDYSSVRNLQAKQVFFGDKPSAANNTDNKIGGQTIIGGKDNDIFFGVDPAFYNGVPTAILTTYDQSLVINRYAFLNPEGDTKNQRFNVQQFETIKMFGGEGADIFYLGNPASLNFDGSQFTGNAAYRIAGSHNKITQTIDRKQLSWADHDHAPNTYVFNLSTSAKSYTNTSTSFDRKTADTTGPVDFVKAGWEILDTTALFLERTGLSHIPFVHAISSGIAMGHAIYEAYELISEAIHPDPEPIEVESEFLSMPLGNWKQQVIIDDWSPTDVIRITLDTTFGGPSYEEAASKRWKNVSLDLIETNSSNTGKGITLTYTDSTRAPASLINLPGIYSAGSTSQTEGYRSYNFTKASYEWITARDLDFFGHIALGSENSKISPLENYQADNGFVFSSKDLSVPAASYTGSYKFYWNDEGALGAKGLDDARQMSSALTLEFDSRKFGWYWQPAFKKVESSGTGAQAILDSIELDPQNSRLWYSDGPSWKFYTFDEIQLNTDAMITALRATTHYAVTQAGQLRAEARHELNEKTIESLIRLQTQLKDLSQLRQPDTPTESRIEKLYEITNVVTVDGGVKVFYAKDSGTYTTIIRKQNDVAIADAAMIMARSAVLALEQQTNIDLDADGVIGPSGELLTTGGVKASFVFNAFEDILDRTPTSEELSQGVLLTSGSDSATTLTELPGVRALITKLVYSDEFLERHTEDDVFVKLLYAELLGNSEPTETDVSYFVSLLYSGLSREDIAWLFINSDAHTDYHGSEEGSLEIVGTNPDPSVYTGGPPPG